jgi:hypothetical protein
MSAFFTGAAFARNRLDRKRDAGARNDDGGPDCSGPPSRKRRIGAADQAS